MSLLQKLSGFVKTFRIRKNFPVSIADALTGFFWLCLHVATSSDIDLAHHQCWLRKPSRVGGLTESCLTWPSHLFILLWTPSSACRLPVMWDLFFFFHSFMLFKTLNPIFGLTITKHNTQKNANSLMGKFNPLGHTSVYHRDQNRLDYHLNVLWLSLPGFLNFVVLTGACNLGNLIPVIAKLSYFNVALFFDVQDLFCRHLLFWHRQYIIPSAILTFWILFLGPGPNIVYPSHRLTH